jgi:hypothetical protein
MRTTAAAIALIREEEGHAALRHIGSLRERDRVESASHREDKRSGHVRHMLPARAALSPTVSVQRVRYKVGNRRVHVRGRRARRGRKRPAQYGLRIRIRLAKLSL